MVFLLGIYKINLIIFQIVNFMKSLKFDLLVTPM